MIDIAESRKKTLEDLKKGLEKLKTDAQKVVSGIMQKKEKNTSKIRDFKKDIARMEMLISEKLKEVKGK